MEALRMADEEAKKKGTDVMAYIGVHKRIKGRFGLHLDQAWVDSVQANFDQSLLFAEADLKRRKESGFPELICEGYLELGNLYYSHGYLADALEAYIETAKHMSPSTRLAQLYFRLIAICIEGNHFDRVLQYVDVASRIPDPLDAVAIAKLHASAGLAYLNNKQYKLAAFQFLEVGPELGSSYLEVIALEDVAIYGALCALATFNSTDIQTKVLDNSNFGSLLALVPDVWNLINQFYNSQHTLCLETLSKLGPDLMMDGHLANHVEILFLVISQKCEYMAAEGFRLDELFLQSPNQHEEGDVELTIVRSNLVLPGDFNDDSDLAFSTNYKFVKCKELFESLNKGGSRWLSMPQSCALLENAPLFVTNSGESERINQRVDGRILLVTDEKYSMINVEYESYTTTRRILKEKQLKDKENSVIGRGEGYACGLTRAIICCNGEGHQLSGGYKCRC